MAKRMPDTANALWGPMQLATERGHMTRPCKHARKHASKQASNDWHQVTAAAASSSTNLRVQERVAEGVRRRERVVGARAAQHDEIGLRLSQRSEQAAAREPS